MLGSCVLVVRDQQWSGMPYQDKDAHKTGIGRFHPGRTVLSDGVQALLDADPVAAMTLNAFLRFHQNGQWGNISADAAAANERSLARRRARQQLPAPGMRDPGRHRRGTARHDPRPARRGVRRDSPTRLVAVQCEMDGAAPRAIPRTARRTREARPTFTRGCSRRRHGMFPFATAGIGSFPAETIESTMVLCLGVPFVNRSRECADRRACVCGGTTT